MNATRKDSQRQRVYAWEHEFTPHEDTPAAINPRRPFSEEFLRFHAEAWSWGFERWGRSLVSTDALGKSTITAVPPKLRYSYRLRSASGHAGVRFDRGGKLGPIITFGQRGPTRKTLLHEQAHLLTCGDRHGPRFCAVALDLYEQFLGASRTVAIFAAMAHQVSIDLSCDEDPPFGRSRGRPLFSDQG